MALVGACTTQTVRTLIRDFEDYIDADVHQEFAVNFSLITKRFSQKLPNRLKRRFKGFGKRLPRHDRYSNFNLLITKPVVRTIREKYQSIINDLKNPVVRREVKTMLEEVLIPMARSIMYRYIRPIA